MEAARRNQSARTTKRHLIVATWQSLGCPSVGKRELRSIQKAIVEQFRAAADESPAAIARVLADEGAELRHPEVIEFDAHWRQAQIEKRAADFSVFDRFEAAKPLRLKQAEALIKRLEKLRQKFERADDELTLRNLQSEAVNARQIVQSLAKSEKLSQRERGEQIEILEWLSVWIRTPKLFEEWLELRKRSTDFRHRFLAKDAAP